MSKTKKILLVAFFVVFGGFGLLVPMFTNPERGSEQLRVLLAFFGRVTGYLLAVAVIIGLLAVLDRWWSNRKQR